MSYWSQYLNRTGQVMREGVAKVVQMKGVQDPSRAPRTLFSLNSTAEVEQFATGCDADNGGTSTVNLDLDTSPENNASIGKTATAKFWGDMRLGVKPGSKLPRGGYAAFRNKNRPTLFGNVLDDIEFHQYIALRLRLAGDPSTHNSYFVNIQSETTFATDLWQHRLYFKRKDNKWEDVFIPFSSFVRTNAGQVSEVQLTMGHQIRSVGIALLGGHSNSAGKYELGIDSIRIVNEEDVGVDPPSDDPRETSG